MYSLFSNPQRKMAGETKPYEFNNFADKTIADIDRIVEHYRSNNYSGKIEHLVCRLILAMNIPMLYDPEQYYDVATARYQGVASMLGLTTSINRGRWHYGTFYHDCPEIIIAYNEYDRPLELVKDWRNLNPIKVLEHPVSNLAFMLPNGLKHNTERGLAVIAINVPMLMLQWYKFCELQIWRKENIGTYQGVTHFLYQYVFPNMLYSQTDLVIFNRLVNLKEGRPMGVSTRKHSFYISDYSDTLDSALEKVLKVYETKQMRYADVLWQVPKIYNDFPLKMPDVAATRQIWWALFLTRLKAIKFLLEVGGEPLRQYNRGVINDLYVDLKAIKQDNVFPQYLEDRLKDTVMDDIAMITTLVRK